MHAFISKKSPLRSYKTRAKSLDLLANTASQLPKLLLTNKVQEKIHKPINDVQADDLKEVCRKWGFKVPDTIFKI